MPRQTELCEESIVSKLSLLFLCSQTALLATIPRYMLPQLTTVEKVRVAYLGG